MQIRKSIIQSLKNKKSIKNMCIKKSMGSIELGNN